MKATRPEWVARQKAVLPLWKALRPDEKVIIGTVTKSDMRIYSRLNISNSVSQGVDIECFRSSTTTWIIRLRAVLMNTEMSALASRLQEKEIARPLLVDFEVLATFNLLEKIAGYDLPELALDAGEAVVRSELAEYCRRIDRIWHSVGGCSAENVRELVLWLIRNRHRTGVGGANLSFVGSALFYGQPALARELLREIEDEVNLGLQDDPTHELKQKIHAYWMAKIDKALAIVDQGPPWTQ